MTLLCTALGACNTADRLSQVGATPALSAIEDPTTQPGYKPVRMPMPDVQPVSYAPNSLWRTGSRAFFKDQRAARLGDLLTVKVNVTDQANISNETKRSRANTESFGLPNALGLENNAVGKAFGVGGTALLAATSATAPPMASCVMQCVVHRIWSPIGISRRTGVPSRSSRRWPDHATKVWLTARTTPSSPVTR